MLEMHRDWWYDSFLVATSTPSNIQFKTKLNPSKVGAMQNGFTYKQWK